MEQLAIVDVLRRHAAMIVVVCVAAIIAGYGASFLLPTKYSATTLVLVRPQQPIAMGSQKDTREFLDFPMGGASAVETASKTYIEILKSPAITEQVVREVGLDKEETAKPGRLSGIIPASLKPAYDNFKQSAKRLMAILAYGKVIEDDPFDKAVKEVAKSLKLEAVLDTYAFNVTCTETDPQRAAGIANAAAKALIAYVKELRVSEGKTQAEHLRGDLEQSRQKVEEARKRLETYKAEHSVFLYKPEYDAKLRVISELEVDLARADAALVGSENTLAKASLAAKRQQLARSLNNRKAELASLPEIERQLLQREEGLKAALASYEIVDKAYQEAELNQTYAIPEVGLVSAAVVPRLPTSPRRAVITGVSFLAGLVVAVSLAFFLEYLNRGVRNIRDIEEFVGLKVLTTIPAIPRRRWRLAGLP